MSVLESHEIPQSERAGRYERDRRLLQQFVTTRSEEAFAALFRRYHPFVYSICLREIGDADLATDAAQIVFIALAGKAPTIRRGTALSAWLFQAARFAARDLVRKERRRNTNEQIAMDEIERSHSLQMAEWEDTVWRRANPLLNDALARLSERDRLAVLLRYFDGLSLAECALALNATNDAARMRIARALGKLRRQLERSGVVLTMTALSALLLRHENAGAVGAATPLNFASYPPANLIAAKGVVFKMNVSANILLCKPALMCLLATGAALSIPTAVPHARVTFPATQTAIRPDARIASSDPNSSLPVVDGSLLLGLIDRPTAVAGQSDTVSAPADQELPSRPNRQANPPIGRDSPSNSEASIDFASLVRRQPYPTDLLAPDTRALLQQLAAQTEPENANGRTRQIVTALRSIQLSYTKAGRLDEAVAVRDAISDFDLRLAGVHDDPGTLATYRENVGRSYLFRVVGSAAASNILGDLPFSSISVKPLGDAIVPSIADPAANRYDLLTAEAGLIPEAESFGTQRNSEVIITLTRAIGNGHPAATIWGTDIYTDDSPLAAVAVHAGLLAGGQKGVLRVTIFAGRDDYDGSSRNGVTSSSYGPWGGSYMVEKAPGFEVRRSEKLPAAANVVISALGDPSTAGESPFRESLSRLEELRAGAQQAAKLDEALALRSALEKLIAKRLFARADPGSLMSFRGRSGRQLVFFVTGRTSGSVWGDEIYTDDSDLGSATVHAGLLKPGQVGFIRVTTLPGQAGFTGSRRNGVASIPYGPWPASYRLEILTDY